MPAPLRANVEFAGAGPWPPSCSSLPGRHPRPLLPVRTGRVGKTRLLCSASRSWPQLLKPALSPPPIPPHTRVDVRFVAHNKRISFAEDTKLAAAVEEDRAWRERVASSFAASSSGGGGGGGGEGGDGSGGSPCGLGGGEP
jgi:hypothetical protein